MYHYCTLGFYGKPPIGNISFYDGEVFTLEAAQETVETLEQYQRELSFARLLVLRGHKSVQKATGRFMVKNRSMSSSIPQGKT
jgi:hypothetical protein